MCTCMDIHVCKCVPLSGCTFACVCVRMYMCLWCVPICVCPYIAPTTTPARGKQHQCDTERCHPCTVWQKQDDHRSLGSLQRPGKERGCLRDTDLSRPPSLTLVSAGAPGPRVQLARSSSCPSCSCPGCHHACATGRHSAVLSAPWSTTVSLRLRKRHMNGSLPARPQAGSHVCLCVVGTTVICRDLPLGWGWRDRGPLREGDSAPLTWGTRTTGCARCRLCSDGPGAPDGTRPSRCCTASPCAREAAERPERARPSGG